VASGAIWNGADQPAGHARIDRMLETIVHRGPDSGGRLGRPGLALGTRRLAIIDLAGGDQPTHTSAMSASATARAESVVAQSHPAATCSATRSPIRS
jgi:asparagine synthase (glutamine-hydrolysing)